MIAFPDPAPRETAGGTVNGMFEIQMEGRKEIVRLTRDEWHTLMRVSRREARPEYLLTPEFCALPSAVRKVVKDWIRAASGR